MSDQELPPDAPTWAVLLQYRVGLLEDRLKSTRRMWATVATILCTALASGIVDLLFTLKRGVGH